MHRLGAGARVHTCPRSQQHRGSQFPTTDRGYASTHVSADAGAHTGAHTSAYTGIHIGAHSSAHAGARAGCHASTYVSICHADSRGWLRLRLHTNCRLQ